MTLRDARTLGVIFVALALAVGSSALGGAALTGAVALNGSTSSTDVVQTDAAQTSIDSCTTIDEPGTYVLTSKIENGGKTAISEACIEITADNVTFDGGGHLIDGRGVSHTKGIAVRNAEDVTIRDVEVDDWHSGILVTEGSATIRDVHTFSNAYGLRLENTTGVTVENGSVVKNLVGVYTNTENVTINGTDFSGNEMKFKRDY